MYVCVPLSTDPLCAIYDSVFRWALVDVGCALLLFGGAGVLYWIVRSARATRRQRWLAFACLIAGIGALALALRAWVGYLSIHRIPWFGTPQSMAAFLDRINNVVALTQVTGWTMLAITAILLVAAGVQIRRARRDAPNEMNHRQKGVR